MDQKINLDLDPQKVLEALREMGAHSAELAKQIEDSLGKDASKSIKKLEDSAEQGTTRIGSFFKNLGNRVREDLKTAFDFTRVLAGVKFTDEVAKGARQVLDMERAFDRLNVRLGASREEFGKFKTELGKTVSAAGASLEKVIPGIDAVVARGGVKNTGALAEIGKVLSQAQVATGEDAGGLAENIVDAIQARGEKVTAGSVKTAIDAAIAARNQGTFSTTTEAAGAISSLTPFAKQLGLGTRQTAALAAQASAAGGPGVDVLRQLLEQGSQVGGQGRLNSILGTDIFKGGKFNTDALSKINLKKFGGLTEQQMAGVTGFSGASGDDFVRFVNAFKQGNDRFKAVLSSSDDTAKAFEQSTQNFASRLDRFKEKLTNAGREIVGGLTDAAEGALSGNKSRLGSGLSKAGHGVADNAGALAVGTGGTLAMGLLFGGGLRNLLGKAGGIGTGLAEGKALSGLGVQSVYVVNFAEMGGGSPSDKLESMSKIGKIGSGILSAIASPATLAIAGAGAVGYAALHSEASHGTDQELAERDRLMRENQAKVTNGNGLQPGMDPNQAEQIAQAVRQGAEKAKLNVTQKGPYTNPSAVSGRGGGR